jgi:predicted DNA-binding mobile mystery protein A
VSNEQQRKMEKGMPMYPQMESEGSDLAEVLKLLKLMEPGAGPSRANVRAVTPLGVTGEPNRDAAAPATAANEQGAPVRKQGRKSWPGKEEARRLRTELDEIGIAFRLCRSAAHRPEGWMRAVRQAIGLPAAELARRMKVRQTQVFRLEESEQQGRVRVATLRRAADAMGCELVYALVPREGKLVSMAAMQRAEDEARRERAAAERRARRRAEGRSRARVPRGETIREEAERLGIAEAIYGTNRNRGGTR